MKVRRNRERAVWCPPSVPWYGCSQLLICCNLIDLTQISLNNVADLIFHVWMEQCYTCPHGLRSTAERMNPCFPDTLAGALLSYHLQETSPTICSQSYILKVVFFLHRDICIEMFYSELLLIECSEAELGEGTGKLLQWHRMMGQGFGAGLTHL